MIHQTRVCSNCGVEKRDDEFWWDDGILLGESKRCKECRMPCPDCKRGRKGRVRVRCERHAALWQGPVYPAFRYPIRSHVVKRYIERVNPTLSGAGARLEILTILQHAVETTDAPPWVSNRDSSGAAFHRGYLVIGELAFALSFYGSKGVMVSTVLTKAMAFDDSEDAEGYASFTDEGATADA